MKKIGIVILNYKVFKDTIDCISSIQAQSYQNFEIVIVDNASNNGSFEYLADKYKYFSNIHLIKSRDNIGFAQGNNLGIKFLKRKKSIFNILVINADTILDDTEYLKKLTSIKYSKKCAMIGSEIIGRDGINQNPYHPAVDQPKVLRLRQYTNIKQIFLMSLIPCKIYQKLRKIKRKNNVPIRNNGDYSLRTLDLFEESLMGAAIYFTEHYLERFIGFFPETFLYYEEDYLALICKRLEMEQLYVPGLKIQHKEESSSSFDLNFSHSKIVKEKRLLVESKKFGKRQKKFNRVQLIDLMKDKNKKM
ncbi:hypothetical protein B9W73_11540 [Lactococcus lactis]|uniref:glycosyltransferase n=1 Tax=Lactococcus lactis TaxID=1358 RepID=UPI000A1E09C0|nr:glycosyltransferase [Lactococcus lactis]OSP86280.1 hypothetical protein B9W73_11540 [Lactococcus lactis]